RDLRGTFLSRLRETYLVLDPESVLGSPTSQEEDATPSRVGEAPFSVEVSAANRTDERRASLGVPDFRSEDDGSGQTEYQRSSRYLRTTESRTYSSLDASGPQPSGF